MTEEFTVAGGPALTPPDIAHPAHGSAQLLLQKTPAGLTICREWISVPRENTAWEKPNWLSTADPLITSEVQW